MFKFKNISSTEMKVICEEEDNLISRSALSYEENSSGIFFSNRYNNVDGTIKLFVMDKTKINEIYAWLSGEGLLEYNNKVSTTYFLEEIKPQRTASIKTIDLNFKRSPYWYKKEDNYVECSNTVSNEGNVFSQPTIKIVKGESDVVDITINGIRFKYTFPTNEEYVIIDSYDCNAYYNGLYRNENLEIDFEFPILNPGENQIAYNSGSCQLFFLKKDRWV